MLPNYLRRVTIVEGMSPADKKSAKEELDDCDSVQSIPVDPLDISMDTLTFEKSTEFYLSYLYDDEMYLGVPPPPDLSETDLEVSDIISVPPPPPSKSTISA
jgi:hypothetical protein